ncbi:GNAT family N-acetyltransferase [Actinoplanes hulinensis]|uniref:GNAT family N-acetyltransferase n=1 Tax=Actinoplanes hulinensis TaxID=1144547 RepID=A0ABS7B7Z1_9ACTN|nr:GNAT family N-acetyltransferase [Actinoplanes hulinensis]MBW6437177.1 GNAT family N-acetyltransferase [Actinoplanes hulinensis]
MPWDASHANHRSFWRHMARVCGGESLEIPGGLLVRVGLVGGSWNQLHLDPGGRQEAALNRAAEYFAGHGLPWRLYAEQESPTADAFAARYGVPAQPLYPVLNRPAGPLDGSGDDGLETSVAAGSDDLREFADCAGEAYGVNPAVLGPLVSPRAFDDPAFRFHLGRHAGRVVAVSVSVHHADTVGVYFVGVRPEQRRHGFGRTVTAQAVRAVPGAGTAVLQATPAGLSIYQEMGFRIVTEYRYWNFA